jgi:hypothetical protein
VLLPLSQIESPSAYQQAPITDRARPARDGELTSNNQTRLLRRADPEGGPDAHSGFGDFDDRDDGGAGSGPKV